MTELYFNILAAVAPAIVLAIIMIWKDKRPEPIGWLLVAVGLGILVGLAVLLLSHLGWPDFDTDTFVGAVMDSFISTALSEEVFKLAALSILVKRCKHFDEMFDGIVYAVCIGMGFAGFENILYLFGAEDEWISVGVSRALMSVPMHYVFAIIMGTFFSLGWFDKKNRKVYMTAALVLPIIVHGLYDTLCFTMGLNEVLSGSILIAFLLSFKYIHKYVKSLTNSMLKLDEYGTVG